MISPTRCGTGLSSKFPTIWDRITAYPDSCMNGLDLWMGKNIRPLRALCTRFLDRTVSCSFRSHKWLPNLPSPYRSRRWGTFLLTFGYACRNQISYRTARPCTSISSILLHPRVCSPSNPSPVQSDRKAHDDIHNSVELRDCRRMPLPTPWILSFLAIPTVLIPC